MRLEKRKRAAEIAVRITSDLKKMAIIHVGALNTRDAVELAVHAARTGATAVSSMLPAGRDHKQLFSYCHDIARASGLPLIIYYIPMVTGSVVSLEEMLKLL